MKKIVLCKLVDAGLSCIILLRMYCIDFSGSTFPAAPFLHLLVFKNALKGFKPTYR